MNAAVTTLSQPLIESMLGGYNYDGDFARSTIVTSTNPTSDRKLWLIGAVLGPVGFALLLICVFCYLHYKCRPRPTNRASAKVYPSIVRLYSLLFFFLCVGYSNCTSEISTRISKRIFHLRIITDDFICIESSNTCQ